MHDDAMERAQRLDVADVMTPHVVTCRSDDRLSDVARRMHEHGVGCAPVLDANGSGRVVGMLTDRDLCLAAVRERVPLAAIPAARAMRSVVRVCWPSDSVEAADAIMRAHGVRRLPVVDPRGALVGLISLTDIAVVALGRPEEGGRGHEPALCSQVVETFALTSRGGRRHRAERRERGQNATLM